MGQYKLFKQQLADIKLWQVLEQQKRHMIKKIKWKKKRSLGKAFRQTANIYRQADQI